MSAPEAFDLRLAAPFVAVAEELHFGRAAARLATAPSALSQQIARLERQLGARLFDRDGRRVALTAAGERFLAEVREILARASLVEEALVGPAELRIHPGDTDNTRTNRLITTFAATHLDLAIRFVGGTLSGGAAVHSGDAEIGIDLREGAPDGTDYLALDRHPIGAVCGRAHRFAGRDELPWSELADELVRVAPPGWTDGYNSCIRALLSAHGVRYREVVGPRYVPSLLVDHIAASPAVHLASAFTFRPWPAELAWVPLTPTAYFEFGAVWRPDRLSPAGRSLLDWMAADVERNPVEVVAAPGRAEPAPPSVGPGESSG